jgi:hypothetical protein
MEQEGGHFHTAPMLKIVRAMNGLQRGRFLLSFWDISNKPWATDFVISRLFHSRYIFRIKVFKLYEEDGRVLI